MKKAMPFVLVLTLAALLIGCLGGGPKRTYVLEVIVLELSGEEPLAGATVVVTPLSGAGSKWDETGADGKVSFSGLTGEIEIQVSLENFVTESKNSHLNQNRSVTFLLIPGRAEAEVEDQAELRTALEDLEVTGILLTDNISLTEELEIRRPVNLDLGVYSLSGRISYVFDEQQTVELKGSGELEGDLVVNAPQAHFSNGIKVAGAIYIEAISPATWQEHCSDNELVVNAPRATLDLFQGARSVTVSENGQDCALHILDGTVQAFTARAPVTVYGGSKIVWAEVFAEGIVFDQAPREVQGTGWKATAPEPNQGTVMGRLLIAGQEDLVIERVSVELYSGWGPGEVNVIVKNGKFRFDNVPEGIHVLSAGAVGYEAALVELEVEAGRVKRCDLHLVREFPEQPLSILEEVLVPGGPRGWGPIFPVGTDDSQIWTGPDYQYWLAQYPVTYELWEEVRNWASDPERGEERYHFFSPGKKGNDGAADKSGLHPVTDVNWYTALVWCNALTEYYNATSDPGTELQCVYTDEITGEPLRDSRRENWDACAYLNRSISQELTGFRLPFTMEWEFAARYLGPLRPEEEPLRSEAIFRDGLYWRPGNYASGATSDYSDALATKEVAWYQDNSGDSTHEVGTKRPNELGIYDLSGNVYEWCFYSLFIGQTAGERPLRGGGWAYPAHDLSIGADGRHPPENLYASPGFRVARFK